MIMVAMGTATPTAILVRVFSRNVLSGLLWTAGSVVFERPVITDAEFIVLTALEDPGTTVEVTNTTLEVVKLNTGEGATLSTIALRPS